jgi:plasmid stability protein
MPTLVIKSVPAKLHSRLKRIAASHRRSLTQETMHLLEKALAAEDAALPPAPRTEQAATPRVGPSYWATRPLQPAFAAALAAGAFSDGEDSTATVSAMRDER